MQLHNSTDTQVVLDSVTLASSGRYRCEVSAEAPSFQTVSDHGDMIVVGEYEKIQQTILKTLNKHEQQSAWLLTALMDPETLKYYGKN